MIERHRIFVQEDDADSLNFRGDAAIWVRTLEGFMVKGSHVLVCGGYRQQNAVIDGILEVPEAPEYRYKIRLAKT